MEKKADLVALGKRIKELAKHLSERPGEFGRRLDYMIASANISSLNNIISLFKESVAKKIPTTVLLQIMSNFYIRTNSGKDIRIVMPKGNVSKVKLLEEKRKPIDPVQALQQIFPSKHLQ